MSIGLIRETVVLEPHDDLWDSSAKEVIKNHRNIAYTAGKQSFIKKLLVKAWEWNDNGGI